MYKVDEYSPEKNNLADQKHFWGVILTGNEGIKLQNMIEYDFGYSKPKLYNTFNGSKNLIRHTINRVSKIIDDDRILTVVNKEQSSYFENEINNRPERTIIVQPYSRGPEAGILLSVLKINQLDPDSVIAIIPSDHFIADETRFMEYVMESYKYVSDSPELLLMLSVKPQMPETLHGIFEQAQLLLKDNNKVVYNRRKFREIPDSTLPNSLLTNGFLLNTFVLIGKTSSLIKYFELTALELFQTFKPIHNTLGSNKENSIIKQTFKKIPREKFSKSVFDRIQKHLCVIEVLDVFWSDLSKELHLNQDKHKFNYAGNPDIN